MANDRISGEQQGSNSVGYSSSAGADNKVKYALNSYDTDAEELTPERKKQIFEQFEKDRAGIDKPTQKQLWGERAAWVAHNMTRVFPNMPERGERGAFFAEFRKSMIQWKNLPTTASFMVQDKLNKMTEGLTPEEFKTFSELVYFLDLKERQGSTKAINTDFLAVEYKAMLQMQYDVYIAETLGKIKKQYDIKPQLEDEAFRNNKNALNEIIKKEATDKDGNIILDDKGKPDSETYRKQMWYNSRIMFGFDGLFDLAERDELPTYDGEYAKVVEALKRHELNVPGLYKYVGIIASTDLPDNATDAQEQAVLNARTVLKYTSQKREWIKSVLADSYQTWETIAKSMSDTHTIHQPRRGIISIQKRL